jgi:hypothetical protein
MSAVASPASLGMGRAICSKYFDQLNTNRKSLHLFYAPEATLVWIDAVLEGRQQIQRYFCEPAASADRFEVTERDLSVQTIPSEGNPKALVVVTGLRNGRRFHCTFVLRGGGGKAFIEGQLYHEL